MEQAGSCRIGRSDGGEEVRGFAGKGQEGIVGRHISVFKHSGRSAVYIILLRGQYNSA